MSFYIWHTHRTWAGKEPFWNTLRSTFWAYKRHTLGTQKNHFGHFQCMAAVGGCKSSEWCFDFVMVSLFWKQLLRSLSLSMWRRMNPLVTSRMKPRRTAQKDCLEGNDVLNVLLHHCFGSSRCSLCCWVCGGGANCCCEARWKRRGLLGLLVQMHVFAGGWLCG
jgi:hypothetical protein